MKIKLIITILAITTLFISEVKAQEEANKISLGTHFMQFQGDLGLGINMTSPYFFNKKMAARIRANTGVFDDNLQLGLTYTLGWVEDMIRLNLEAGVNYPVSRSNSQSTKGGYGLLGFDFFVKKTCSYFIEIGGMGGGALTNAGVRIGL